jgi:hypothetical protein
MEPLGFQFMKGDWYDIRTINFYSNNSRRKRRTRNDNVISEANATLNGRYPEAETIESDRMV